MALSFQPPAQDRVPPSPSLDAPTSGPVVSPFGGNLANLQGALGNQELLARFGVGAAPAAVAPGEQGLMDPAPIPEGSHARVLDIDFEAQRLGYTCGPTSAHNALSARMENAPSQEELAERLHTHEHGGTNWIGEITEVMNSYLEGDPYVTTEMPQDPPSPESTERLWKDIMTSIDNNYPVVANIWAPPGVEHQPPGYPNELIQHYFTVTGYNPDTSEVHIADSANFENVDPSYRHQYWLPLQHLAALIPPKGYTSYRPPEQASE